MLDKLENKDKGVLGFLAFHLLSLLTMVFKLKHIPGPLFGGDLYMIRGFTQAILQGKAPWVDPYFAGHYAYYGWLSYWVTAFLVRLTGIGLERMSIILPAFIQVLIMGAGYLFGSKFFKSKKYGIIFMLSLLSLRIIDIKISGAFATLFVLLSLWSWTMYEQGNKKHKYWMGVFLGLTGLSHILSFISVVGLIGFAVIFESIKRKKIPIKKYFIPGLITLIITLALIGPWIFVYNMNTLNPSQQYSHSDITQRGIGWIFQMVFKFFIRRGIWRLISGLVALVGLIFVCFKKKNFETRTAKYFFIGGVLLTSHFLITKPLLNNWIAPGLLWGTVNWVVYLVLLVYGLRTLQILIKNDGIFLIITGILLIGLIFQSYTNFNKDRWVNYGRQADPQMQVMFQVEDWILTNTEKDSVFLGNDESSFALNALTGRSLVIARRTHANYYVDVDKRYADAMVMLYGNNKTRTIELLRKYDVDYLYVDSNLIERPMLTRKKFENYLLKNGVNISIQNVRFDPAVADAPVYEAIVIPPQQLRLVEHNLTVPVKQFLIGQNMHSLIYQIKT
ncbi:MAG: hypothetical protein MAG795_00113 [Candidatus Woesearchaeota archaeon]|nr:hypothetical protein [Candidatus Woesearchaeota archaeon]